MNNDDSIKKRQSISRHPLTIVIAGFLLSGVAGTGLSNFYSDKQNERARFFEVTAARRAAIQDFARLLYERRTRAEMLHSSMKRQAPIEEINERKRLYDEAYVAWGSNLQANLFMIRSVLEADTYSDFEGHVEFRLVPILRNIDSCLTKAYDENLRERDPLRIVDGCGINKELQLALDCGYAITDELFRVAAPISPLNSDQERLLRSKANAEIARRCKVD